jgi:hypothetical protein
MMVAGAALVAASGVLTAVADAAPSRGSAFQQVAVDRWAAAQPTATGRTILELSEHDGKVIAGYGDYSANTGPITISSVDPTTGSVEDLGVADTEATYTIRTLNGKLFAPSTDPRNSADFAEATPFTSHTVVGAWHAFDMASLGTDLWLVGSQGSDAVAWRSLDGGTTWQESLRIAPMVAGDYARFYFAATFGGNLYVQAVDMSKPHAGAMVFDGTSWADAPTMLPSTSALGWHPQPFGKGVVYHDWGHGYSGNIMYYDGVSATSIAGGYDFTVDNGNLFVLGNDGIVTRSTDLKRWSVVTQAAPNARSVEVAGSQVVVGTTDSTLLAAPLETAKSVTSTTSTKTRPSK